MKRSVESRLSGVDEVQRLHHGGTRLRKEREEVGFKGSLGMDTQCGMFRVNEGLLSTMKLSKSQLKSLFHINFVV